MNKFKSRKFVICLVIVTGTFGLLYAEKISSEAGVTLISSVLSIYSAYNHAIKPIENETVDEKGD